MPEPSLTLDFVLFVIFGVVFLIQLYYYLIVFGRFAFCKRKSTSGSTSFPPVTVIIAAKNEEINLQKNLPLILDQDYPVFEVIVVNDFSTDETYQVLEAFEAKHSNIRAITIKQEGSHHVGKKYPITLGLKGAKYEHVLFTDADCSPKSRDWIKSMMAGYAENTEIVLGYGAYEKKKGLLNKLIRFDTFYVAIQYFSMALGGKPYMGVGRNMSYKKDLFFRNKGFATHTHIASGDDDLFVNKVATAENTGVVYFKDAHTVSVPKRSFAAWIQQKRRHLTTGKYYKSNHKLMLGMFSLTNVLFILLFLALVVVKFPIEIILSIFLFKLLVQIIIFRQAMVKLDEKDLIFLAPFLDLFIAFFHPYLYLSNPFIKPPKWK
jgi:cellulose synthase/poly-beta-1,6-N-acetylglucosamine synthase-like glycosyltransferase